VCVHVCVCVCVHVCMCVLLAATIARRLQVGIDRYVPLSTTDMPLPL